MQSPLEQFFDVDPIDVNYHYAVKQPCNPSADKDWCVESIFQYLRKNGFPHYRVTEIEKIHHMRQLCEIDYDSLLVDGHIIQTMHALRLAWSYFPHAWDVKCGSSKMSPLEAFNDDATLRLILEKAWNWCVRHKSCILTENRIRQSLKIYAGVQSVSNFRPSAAGVIYHLYGNNGVTWDMSSGWGGRLLAALASKNIRKYIGTEPSSQTYCGLLNIVSNFTHLGKTVELHQLGAEDYVPEKESLDLCFTSPPYFDTEKYSDEPSQSYIKFPNEELWVNGFLLKMLQNCQHGLKSGGHLVINIADTQSTSKLERMTCELACSLGFVHETTLFLDLSSIAGKGIKTEPIFVFRKP